MPLTKATTNVVNLDKDTLINGLTVGRGGGNQVTNVALGVSALPVNSGGLRNTSVGEFSMYNNTSGVQNTAIGSNALAFNVAANNNTAVGYQAILKNVSGYNNTASGVNALRDNTVGYENTATGFQSLTSNTTGTNNTASGVNALYSNTTGVYNTASGFNALYNNTTGDNNTAFGNSSLALNTTGFNNAAIGSGALQNNTTGHSNSAVGALALSNNTIFLNVGGFGYNAQVSGDNQIRIGDTNITSVTCQTNAWSDERDKADIRDTVLGLDFIKELRPVDYKWDYREDYRPEAPASVSKPAELKEDASDEEKAKYAEELAAYNAYKVKLDKWLEDCKWSNLVHDGTHKRNRFHHGLIAQEVKAVIEKTGVDFGGFQDHTIKGGDAVMTIGYTELIGPLIKAVQELSAEVAALKAK